MSQTRIICEKCGFVQIYCTCTRPDAPSSLAVAAGSAVVYHKLAAGLVLENSYSGTRVTVVCRSPRRGATSWVVETDRGCRLVYCQIDLFRHFREPNTKMTNTAEAKP